MRHLLSKRSLATLAALCAAMLLSACAATGKKTETIEERVNGRWAALLAKDYEGAYEYLTPGFRSSVSLQQYQRSIENRKVRWTSAKYVNSNCEESSCAVRVNIGYTVYGLLPGVKSMNSTQHAEETWILVDRKWYLVPQQ